MLDLNLVPRLQSPEARSADFERRLETLRGALKARAADLAKEVFPAGVTQGENWRIGDLTGARGESLAITIKGDRAGLWKDHATDEGGDLIDLWRATQGYQGEDGFVKAVEDLELHLGISPGFRSTGAVSKVATERAKKAASEPRPPAPLVVDEVIHRYLDASGHESARVVRKTLSDGSKTFIQQRRAANGAWESKSPDVRPIFQAYELASEATLVLVEGEKCAQLLREQGIPAVSLMGGANAKLDGVQWSMVAGKRIILWPDADAPGRGLMERVEPILREHGCQTAWVQVPANAPDGWDAADLIEEGGKPGDFLLPALATMQSVYTPHRLPSPSFNARKYGGTAPPPREFVYDTFLMRKALTSVAAPPGVGKTTFSMQLALAVAFDMPLGDFEPAQGGGGNVLIYNAEEPDDELDRRFLAACIEMGLDPRVARDRVQYMSGQSDEPGFRPWQLATNANDPRVGEDVAEIKALIARGDYAMLIVDPLTDLHAVKEDTEGMRAVGQALREIATSARCAVLAFHHTPKAASSSASAGDMGALRGGGGLAGTSRFVLTMFTMHPDEAKELGVFADEVRDFVRIDRAKANMSRVGVGANWFRKLALPLNNATADRPADTVAIIRGVDLGARQAGRKAVQENEARAKTLALAEAMARVCWDAQAVSSGAAMAFDDAVRAAVEEVQVLRATTAKANFVRYIRDGHKTSLGALRVDETARGAQTRRKVWLEAA